MLFPFYFDWLSTKDLFPVLIIHRHVPKGKILGTTNKCREIESIFKSINDLFYTYIFLMYVHVIIVNFS